MALMSTLKHYKMNITFNECGKVFSLSLSPRSNPFFLPVGMAWTIETSTKKKKQNEFTMNWAQFIFGLSEKYSSPTGFKRHQIQIKLQAIKIRTRNAIPSAANCGRKGRRRRTSENSTETDACNPNYDEKQKFRKIVFLLSVCRSSCLPIFSR